MIPRNLLIAFQHSPLFGHLGLLVGQLGRNEHISCRTPRAHMSITFVSCSWLIVIARSQTYQKTIKRPQRAMHGQAARRPLVLPREAQGVNNDVCRY